MRSLSASDMLLIWERGQAQTWLARGLTALAVADPAWSLEQLASLSLGRRDQLLFDLHRHTFGAVLNSTSECPQCGQRLEYEFDTVTVLDPAALPGDSQALAGQVWSIEEGGYHIRFHLPDSRDLAACAACPDVPAARQVLLERCVLEIEPPLEALALPQRAIDRLGQELARRDPLAEVAFELECPACATRWQVDLDIGAFLWAEIEHQAKRLLREVAALARATGWSERDILALSTARRRAYLELVT